MAKTSMRGSCSFREAETILRNEIPECGLSCELVEQACHCFGDVQVTVLVFEKYFMRVNNYASLTLMLSGRDGDVCVDVIGAGGRQGMISIAWGAEENFVDSARKVLERHGFYEMA